MRLGSHHARFGRGEIGQIQNVGRRITSNDCSTGALATRVPFDDRKLGTVPVGRGLTRGRATTSRICYPSSNDRRFENVHVSRALCWEAEFCERVGRLCKKRVASCKTFPRVKENIDSSNDHKNPRTQTPHRFLTARPDPQTGPGFDRRHAGRYAKSSKRTPTPFSKCRRGLDRRP